MKTLVIFYKDSFWKFEEVPIKFLFTINDRGYLEIFKRNPNTGEESIHAAFQKWDYFLIENDE